MFTAPISEITLGQVHRSPDLKGGISMLHMAKASGPSKPRSQGQVHSSLSLGSRLLGFLFHASLACGFHSRGWSVVHLPCVRWCCVWSVGVGVAVMVEGGGGWEPQPRGNDTWSTGVTTRGALRRGVPSPPQNAASDEVAASMRRLRCAAASPSFALLYPSFCCPLRGQKQGLWRSQV